MITIGTPGTPNATRLLLLGAGELGKEVALEAQRLGVEVIACDSYEGAPAMQVAHRSRVLDMTDPKALGALLREERPSLVVPEVEAIATSVLLDFEEEGIQIVPTARATRLTMDREGIRRLAAEELGLRTSTYRFCSDPDELQEAVAHLGLPVVVKPIMSSSGKGQSVIRTPSEVRQAWDHAQGAGRVAGGRIIVESFVDFEYEITLLTLRHAGGTSFCSPIGHRQEEGDYHESWQPHPMSEAALTEAQRMARAVTDDLGGRGIFGVEFFVSEDTVWFSEVSPRPHDTGLVTLVSQELSEFALHVRAILGLPVPVIRQLGPAASAVILGRGELDGPVYRGVDQALEEADTELRLFGKPNVRGYRRMGVALARGTTIEEARGRALRSARHVEVAAREG